MLTDDMHTITLFNNESPRESLESKGRFTDVGLTFDQYGMPKQTTKMTVAFNISNFSSIISDITKENFENWICIFLNSEGQERIGRFIEPFIDKTFGYVVTTLVKTDDPRTA